LFGHIVQFIAETKNARLFGGFALKSILTIFVTLITGAGIATLDSPPSEASSQSGRITVRTENYPRPPYSGATYYIYERGGEVICTKLEVCNKYDNCETEYKKGSYKDAIDVETGAAYNKTDAVIIPTAKLRKHVCLRRFKLG